MSFEKLLQNLGLKSINPGAYAGKFVKASKATKQVLKSVSPINRQPIASIQTASKIEYELAVQSSQETFLKWRDVPAPQRGQVLWEIGNALRERKELLGELISCETGKILAEGIGEVQEAIDVTDFAVGLSRQLYGFTMQSERPHHRMYEQWHPLGVVGVITAFNFPMAVWAWNAMVAAVCGDTVLWKPSELAPLSALAINTVCSEVAARHGFPGLFNLIISNGPELGQAMAKDPRIPLISATGSCVMGRSVGATVSARLGRSILELGGNNGIVVLKDADLNLVVPSVLFGAVGTAGQRCTSTRRILIEREIEEEFVTKLAKAYSQVRIGDPLLPQTLMGPLINEKAVENYENAIRTIKAKGGRIVYGGKRLKGMPSELYVEPTIVRAKKDLAIMKEETFAPILYVVAVKNVQEAIQIHNAVPQGLSSAIFTESLKSAEAFLSTLGSDCGIANVNIGTSGAEIGGAFGGEKDTGGGRESGSDSWKQYMRRQTSTINWSDKLPLAQGIKFEV